jgi:hypothetical protein
MAHQIIARSEPVALALPGRSRAARLATARAPAWRSTMFWPAELLRLIGVAFLFPVVILALGLPLAFALTGLLLAAQWVWHILA